MSSVSFGDLAQSALLRRQNSFLKTEMSRLTQELSSGQVQDTAKHLGGDYGYLAEVERSLRVISSFKTSAAEAALITGTMQNALGYVAGALEEMSVDLIATGNGALGQTHSVASDEALGQLSFMVSAFNSDVAGRSVFGGIDTDGAVLASADDILAELRTTLAGQSTLTDIQDVMHDWFHTPGGGFEAIAYQGASQSFEPIYLGESERISIDIRADDTAIREALKATAMAALVTDDTLALSADIQAGMLRTAGETMLAAQDGLTAKRAKLGLAQSRIENASARIATEQTSLGYARGQLLGADPYETITRLEEAQFRLESLYMATARLSQMSLMEYLR